MALQLEVVTPLGVAYSGPVEQVVLPGTEGEFGVLERHERFLAPLQHGVMEIRKDGGAIFAAVSKGFAEVDGARVVVMVERHVAAEDVDVEAARSAREAAEAELEGLGEGDAEADHRIDLEDAAALAAAQVAAAERR